MLKEENNKIIKKEENLNEKVDYFMEEGQLSLTDGRRNVGIKGGGGRKRKGSSNEDLEVN